MLILLDTHVLLSLAEGETDHLPWPVDPLRDRRNTMFASAVSLWEIAIKHRLGKLPLTCPIEEWPDLLSTFAVPLMDITIPQILAEADPLPDTRDPFDRLLLAICRIENMRLATVDRSLIGHPLVWTPAAT